MSDVEEEVLEDFSGMTQINGVTISPPEENKENENNINDIPQSENKNNSNNTVDIKEIPPPIMLPQMQKPKFFDVLKSLGTTTLIVMGLVMLFLLIVGYKYLYG